MLDVEATFCYLGDTLCSGGGCDHAIAARYCVIWGKFRKHLPVLTTRHLSSRIHGKMNKAYVYSVMLHSSETWGPNNPELQRLHHSDCAMIPWICGTKDRSKTSTTSLLQKLDIEDITSVLCSWRLRWYCHVMWVMSCVRNCHNISVPRH